MEAKNTNKRVQAVLDMCEEYVMMPLAIITSRFVTLQPSELPFRDFCRLW